MAEIALTEAAEIVHRAARAFRALAQLDEAATAVASAASNLDGLMRRCDEAVAKRVEAEKATADAEARGKTLVADARARAEQFEKQGAAKGQGYFDAAKAAATREIEGARDVVYLAEKKVKEAEQRLASLEAEIASCIALRDQLNTEVGAIRERIAKL